MLQGFKYSILLSLFLYLSQLAVHADQNSSPPKSFSMAFGSCVTTGEGQIWSAISKKNPSLFLLLGDTFYSNKTHWTSLENYQKGLAVNFISTPASKLLDNVTTYAIWDDHDYGSDNSNRNFKYNHITQEGFENFWNKNPEYVKELRPALTFTKNFGNISLFVLDGRTFRTKVKKGKGSLLGEAQLTWLKNQLLKSSAKVIVIASGTPFLPTIGKQESYSKYVNEQKKFLEIVSNVKKPVILLSGDRHYGQILQAQNNELILEVISSPLTANVAGLDEVQEQEHGIAIAREHNFGWLEIQENSSDINILVELLSGEGESLGRVEKRLSSNNIY